MGKSDKSQKIIKIFSKIWSLIYVATLFFFVKTILTMDVLPGNLLYRILACLAVISLIVFPLLYFRNIKTGRKIVAFFLSIILMGGYAYGISNLQSTSKFFNEITDAGIQTKDYYLVVKKDSPYKKIADVKGKKCGTYFSTDPNYSLAKGELNKNVSLEYKIVKSFSKLDNGLIDGKYETIFVSAAQYKTMCDRVKSFKEITKIIFTVKIDVSQKNLSKKVNVTKDSFNIYISGLDTSGGIKEVSRSDVNMILTVNPRTHVILLTSIPRDYQIKLPSYNWASDKLTHTGIYGISETLGAAEKLTGVDMNYYIKVNYSTVKKLVNAIGGIDVISDYDFTTHGMADQFTFKKGKNHLDGRKALAFARERKAFKDGDVQRNRDQAKVMEAIIKKATSSTTILTQYSNILKKCQPYMRINMEQNEIKALVKHQLNDGGGWKVFKQNMKGTGAYETCYSTGDYQLYVMKPDKKIVESTVANIIKVMDGTITKENKAKDIIKNK